MCARWEVREKCRKNREYYFLPKVGDRRKNIFVNRGYILAGVLNLSHLAHPNIIEQDVQLWVKKRHKLVGSAKDNAK